MTAVVVVVATLGLLANDERRANSRFDRSQASLEAARQRTAEARSELAAAAAGLRAVDGQVSTDRVALARDTAQLAQVGQALSGARTHASLQSQDVTDLRICLAGVQQALNALAVSDSGHAIGALHAVAPSCNSAVAAHG